MGRRCHRRWSLIRLVPFEDLWRELAAGDLRVRELPVELMNNCDDQDFATDFRSTAFPGQ